jgi:hypothetical protein
LRPLRSSVHFKGLALQRTFCCTRLPTQSSGESDLLTAPFFTRANCHRHVLREWLLALKRANVANLPHRRYSSVMRPLRYSINEVGFPDLIQQMWAAFLMEREGALGERFGCATPAEAVRSQQLFAAALESQTTGETISVSWHKVNRST